MWGALALAAAVTVSPPFWPAWPPVADQAQMKVPIQCQMPELDNGCEVVSLSMLLQHAGKPVSRLQLAQEVAKDPTPIQTDELGRITYWGDPNVGFVGDITGKQKGYGVYHGPLTQLLNRHLPGKAQDLSGKNFDKVLESVSSGHPVVAWTTSFFDTTKQWVYWNSPTGQVAATFHEHAVLVVGFNKKSVEINDPLDGKRKRVNREQFRRSWEMMGKQAVTYR
ncbi:C39 family peptidase [Tumebacillus avium]|nr:C39 family peptidase [Tumebacillus avium]